MAVHCPECGFVNDEGANYCQKCGAYLGASEADREATTATYRVDETGEIQPVELEDVVATGAALVIRAGGGRVGESFGLAGERMSVGRHPDSDIFLDDITVSRRHVEVTRTSEGYRVRDVGSLNGTYLNRERIDEAPLSNGDEVQVGKFKLIFFSAPTVERRRG